MNPFLLAPLLTSTLLQTYPLPPPPRPPNHTTQEKGGGARYPLGTAVNIPNLSNQHKHSDLASWSVRFYRELRLRKSIIITNNRSRNSRNTKLFKSNYGDVCDSVLSAVTLSISLLLAYLVTSLFLSPPLSSSPHPVAGSSRYFPPTATPLLTSQF